MMTQTEHNFSAKTLHWRDDQREWEEGAAEVYSSAEAPHPVGSYRKGRWQAAGSGNAITIDTTTTAHAIPSALVWSRPKSAKDLHP